MKANIGKPKIFDLTSIHNARCETKVLCPYSRALRQQMSGNNGGGSGNGVAGPGGPGPGGISNGNASKLKLKIPSIQEEGSEGAEASDTSCPPTAGSTVSEAGSDVEYLVRQKNNFVFQIVKSPSSFPVILRRFPRQTSSRGTS